VRLLLATWNINSIRPRAEPLRRLIAYERPDILCLQETKVADDHFPHGLAQELGYGHRLVRGEPGYNGVAILSRVPLIPLPHRDFCRKGDCRHLAARLPGGIELHNLYVPAGGHVADPRANPKFAHKLAFLDEVARWLKRQRAGNGLILAGDLNVAPLPADVWSHEKLLGVVSHTPIEVEALERIRAAKGFTDALRHFIAPETKLYSWWSYRARDWRASDRGRRLDHIWVTAPLASRLSSAHVLKDARDWSPPSDHAPVLAGLEIEHDIALARPEPRR